MSSMEERMAQLERRVALLEGQQAIPDLPLNNIRPFELPELQPISVHVLNKRYSPSNPNLGTYEDYIWFDCVYTLSAESTPTRAIKGTFEFADLFGEVRFRLQTTLNEPLMAALPLKQEGIGFTYNQFIAEHQWMLVTRLEDIKYSFKISEALYADGTSRSFP